MKADEIFTLPLKILNAALFLDVPFKQQYIFLCLFIACSKLYVFLTLKVLLDCVCGGCNCTIRISGDREITRLLEVSDNIFPECSVQQLSAISFSHIV